MNGWYLGEWLHAKYPWKSSICNLMKRVNREKRKHVFRLSKAFKRFPSVWVFFPIPPFHQEGHLWTDGGLQYPQKTVHVLQLFVHIGLGHVSWASLHGRANAQRAWVVEAHWQIACAYVGMANTMEIPILRHFRWSAENTHLTSLSLVSRKYVFDVTSVGKQKIRTWCHFRWWAEIRIWCHFRW